MDRFLVSGGARLAGEVSVSGAKNRVLQLMAAADDPQVMAYVRRLEEQHDAEEPLRVSTLIDADEARAALNAEASAGASAPSPPAAPTAAPTASSSNFWVWVGVLLVLALLALRPGRDAPASRPLLISPLLAASFARLLMLWRNAQPHALALAWLAHAHPPGTPLTVHASPGETVTGTFAGIDPDGALRLRRDDGSVEVVRAGDVSLG